MRKPEPEPKQTITSRSPPLAVQSAIQSTTSCAKSINSMKAFVADFSVIVETASLISYHISITPSIRVNR